MTLDPASDPALALTPPGDEDRSKTVTVGSLDSPSKSPACSMARFRVAKACKTVIPLGPHPITAILGLAVAVAMVVAMVVAMETAAGAGIAVI
eukprot:CAMPEP_0203720416 /NCGR_PEP_ID=MMETSP0092-20131115/4161_1 /ASSEMBLY_ACC=CAM_ASM_001090 /TAXON_ID=426623 /ORGANISM="Chaetoceros affinis, Strain CCMP159" /LENGTH=92 /DNA_ID=CAMNT_0050600045 /DNA_START=140 /DNA_END=418 /DNA_ORIENTATION=+